MIKPDIAIPDIAIVMADAGYVDALDKLTDDSYDKAYFLRRIQEQTEDRCRLFCAVEGDDIVGCVLLNFRPRYSFYKALDAPAIQDVFVMSDKRRNGIGRALIAYCENIAREEGKNYVGISVGLTASYGAAQRLYVQMGYEPDGNGVTYDRAQVSHGEIRPVDDDLCLMLIKKLS